jgi:cystathionine beta-lyase family protein involved in aluminum resistance
MFAQLGKDWSIDKALLEIAKRAVVEVREQEDRIHELAACNQMKVLKAFQEEGVGETDFYPTTGYGLNDLGRDKLDRIWARVFGTEAALVRHQIVSGTQALALCLYGVLRPGDELISATGSPYDTLETVIGHKGNVPGSLRDYGITYREIPLLPQGEPDLAAIADAISDRTRMVFIQRSRGYSWRPALSLKTIGNIVTAVKRVNPGTVCLVDNCYGEFTALEEPPAVGADLIAGSLIKNPGGGLAPSGGYIAGRAELVEMAAARLTAPGIGSEGGASLDTKRLLYQGLFLAPYIVGEALKGAVFTAQVMESLGYNVSPSAEAERYDLIQAIRFRTKDELLAFCEGVQKAAPVDSMVKPIPAPMPGYTHQVVMACGTFVQGASIELSADAPLREPYIAYVQGGLTVSHVRAAILIALQHLVTEGHLVL